MSLFGSMTTAIGGLTAQARALGHISDNVANSQTVGYKRIDTSFASFITSSSQTQHAPGSVAARPDFTHTVQGPIEQTENKTALALAGQGFFSVTAASGVENGLPSFGSREFFTRAGDFSLDRNGFLVNSSGYYLQGWQIDSVSREPRPGVPEADPRQSAHLHPRRHQRRELRGEPALEPARREEHLQFLCRDL